MKKRSASSATATSAGALARGLMRAGHDVRAVGNDKAAIRDVARGAEVVFLTVPFAAIDDVLQSAGEALDGKIVVDVTNALGPDKRLAVGFSPGGAEQLQKKLPRARVVKAFNTVFARFMETGHRGDEALSAFVAGDDATAKRTVLELARDIGFDAIDSGPLEHARYLEPMAVLNIQLALGGMGWQHAFVLLHD